MTNFYKIIHSPLGNLAIVADKENLIAISWQGSDLCQQKIAMGKLSLRHAVLEQTEKQLQEYFNGQRKTFDLPLSFPYASDFQKKVWSALATIPYATTTSYSDIAKKIGLPKACRAVGIANSKNPIPIVIPCHRVIGKNGALIGFTGGLDKKIFLLTLEQKNRN